jgi:hypothetical protein
MASLLHRGFVNFIKRCSLGIRVCSNLAYPNEDHSENIREANTTCLVTQLKHFRFKDEKHK